jgi:hypothetical protein
MKLSLFATLSLCLATVVPAEAAGVTATPPILIGSPNGIMCAVTNVGKKPIDVTLEVVNSAGETKNSTGPSTLAPGASTGSAIASSEITGLIYCRVQGFSPKQVHVTACGQTFTAIANGTDECFVLTTAP